MEMEPVSELTDVQRKAALVLARLGYVKGHRQRTGAPFLAAEAVNVCRKTIYRWLDIPEFLDEVAKQREKIWLLADEVLMDEMKLRGPQRVLCAMHYKSTINPDVGDPYYIRDRAKHCDRVAIEELRRPEGIEADEPPETEIVFKTVVFDEDTAHGSISPEDLTTLE